MRPKEDYLGAHPLKRALIAVAYFFIGVWNGIVGFFTALPGKLKNAASGLAKAVKNYIFGFIHGHWSVKLSYVIMGAGNFFAGQRIKGLLFFIIEAAFIVVMVLFGGEALVGLVTLGTVTQQNGYDEFGNPIVDEWGNPLVIHGDNSLLMLLCGVCAVLIVIAFLAIYFSTVKSARAVRKSIERGQKPLTFRQDIMSLLDKKLYRTMLFIPILCVLAFTVIPLIYMILMAFTSYDHEHLPPASLFDWIGFEMFGKVFKSAQIAGTFFPVLGWTLVWAFCATISCYFAGILLALLINKKGIVGRPIFRTIFVLTIAIPQFITLLTMNNFLHIDGPLNTLLLEWGIIDERIGFLTDVSNNAILPRISVLVVNLWIGVPYTMLITTGILMNIPKDLFEAAKIDGASPVRLFASITLPYVLFVTGPYLIQQFIGNINNFNIIYLLTSGGPSVPNYHIAGKTDLLITWLYKLTVEQNDYNLGSVIGIYTFICCAVFSLLAYSRSSAVKNEEDFQ